MLKIQRFVEKTERFACIFLTWFIFAVILAHVFGRYVFKYPLYFAEEISRYAFIWSIMIGASIVMRNNAHTRVEYFIGFLPDKSKIMFGIFTRLFIIFFLGYLSYYGIFLVIKTMTVPSAALELPWGLIYLAAPVGSILMTITSIEHIVKDFQLLFSDRNPAREDV